MTPALDRPDQWLGRAPVAPVKDRNRVVLAVVLAVLWPPAILTLPIWWPRNWIPGLEMDWRLTTLLLGAIAVPYGLSRLRRAQTRHGRPSTRFGIVWRFVFYGGLIAAALQATLALITIVVGLFTAGAVGAAIGATVTTLLIFGVGGLAFSVAVGVSYALWAGLWIAFLAYRTQPEVRDRMGVMGDRRA